VIEVAGPVIAERRKGGTPWHAHHIAERYGLLTIITPLVPVIGYETLGYRHMAVAVQSTLARG
jgi:low temperature requirement protein LtrA